MSQPPELPAAAASASPVARPMNRVRLGDVLPDETGMETTTATLTDGTEVERDEPAREFETRLVESSTLAFRVAYSVLRQREDAEDVAQEAFTRA